MTAFRQFGEKLKIASRSYVRVYSAGTFDRHWYPYRLEPVSEASGRVRDNCMEYILDSDISDPTITNREVVEKASEINAQYVIPKDYLPFDSYPEGRWGDEKLLALEELRNEYSDNVEATTESIGDFIGLWKDSDASGQFFIPLHPPYEEHFDEISERFGMFSHYCLGGMKSSSTKNQIDAIDSFIDHIESKHGEWNPYIHALGVGACLGFVRKVQLDKRFRRYVDSIDLSTAEQYGRNGNFADKSWQHTQFHLANGKNRSTLTALQADLALAHLNHMLGPYCWDETIQEEPDMEEMDSKYSEVLEKVMGDII